MQEDETNTPIVCRRLTDFHRWVFGVGPECASSPPWIWATAWLCGQLPKKKFLCIRSVSSRNWNNTCMHLLECLVGLYMSAILEYRSIQKNWTLPIVSLSFTRSSQDSPLGQWSHSPSQAGSSSLKLWLRESHHSGVQPSSCKSGLGNSSSYKRSGRLGD